MNRLLPQQLSQRLAAGLPGPKAGTRFGSRPPLWPYYDPPPAARRAAVLVLLYPHDGRWHLPLTLRPAHLADHPGQVSLPGGAIEPGENSRQAAVREFHEELGAAATQIEMLGELSPLYVPASNFRVAPWVAVTTERPRFDPNRAEVEELIEVPLGHLVDPANLDSHTRRDQDGRYTAPHFIWEPHRIWGATCLILGELVMVVEGLGIGI